MTAKILVIDDLPAMGRAIERMLDTYEVSVETDPRAAVKRIAAGERFDIVLCDLEMPEMSGKEVYETLRTYERPPITLMMSGHANVTPLFAAGCPVLFKPFEAAELKHLVAALLHETESPSGYAGA